MNPDERRKYHFHITSKFRGVAYNACNLSYKLPKNISFMFHNLRNYDVHQIMLKIDKFKDYDVQIIPTTMEKNISLKMIKQGCPFSTGF